jgi:hypothetical protein
MLRKAIKRRGKSVGRVARACALLFAVVACGAMEARAATATLSGRVTDERGARVAGALVTATNLGTSAQYAAKTNDDGLYVFPEVQTGLYRVTVRRDGFREAVREGLEINVEARAKLDFTLAAGDINEVVTVEGDAALVETDTARVETLVDRRFVENLPLNGRSFQTLLEITPGVTLARSNIFAPGQFSVNGQRTNANYFSVDGVSANVAASASAQSFQQLAGTLPALTILGGTNSLASVDALQEFRVMTSSYEAEFGRTPGAQVVISTRSGANRPTFSLFNYFRNEALDANDFFNNRNGVRKLPLRQNNFGGTLGGPVFLPRFGEGGRALYDGRDRTFFFFSYEGLRLTQPQPFRTVRVPSRAAREQATGVLRDIFNAFPLPNAPALASDVPLGAERYNYAVSTPSRYDAVSLRADQRVGQNFNLFGRFNDTPSDTVDRVFANMENVTSLNTRTMTVGATWAVSSKVANDFRANYSRSRGLFEFRGLAVDGSIPPPDALVFPAGLDRENVSANLSFSFAGSPTSYNQGKSLGTKQRQVNVTDSVSVVLGNHLLKFGADYRRLFPLVDFRSLGITYSFASPAAALASGGLATISIQALAPVTDFVVNNYSFFAQDTWRVTRRLTLTYGARYELNPAPSGELLPFTLSDVDNLLTTQLAPPGTRFYRTQKDNFAPRAGAAYVLSERQSLVVRAGFGLFYDVGSDTALRGYSGFPFNSNRTFNARLPVTAADLQPAPFNSAPPYSATFHVTEPELELPRTLQYNFSIERALGRNQTISVAYVGAKADRLLRTETIRNQPQRTIGGVTFPAVTLINPNLFTTGSTVFLTRNTSESRYDSLQAQFTRRLSRGLQALVSYTFSKSVDDASDAATGGFPEDGRIGQFGVDVKNERGPSDFDTRHNLTAAVTYNIPAPFESRAARALFGGWSLDLIGRARSGLPFSVFSQTLDPLVFAVSTRRADVVPGVPVWVDDAGAPGGRRLNRAAFAEAPFGRQGTSGRNANRGLPVYQADLSVRREFPLTEGGLRGQFRAEFFNLFNRANFGLPVSNVSFPAEQFGAPTQSLNRSLGSGGISGGFNPLYQVGGPRSVQLSLKLIY